MTLLEIQTDVSGQNILIAWGLAWQISHTCKQISELSSGQKVQPCSAVLTLPAGKSSDQSAGDGIEDKDWFNKIEENQSWENSSLRDLKHT